MHIGSQYTVGIHILLVVAFFNEDRITSKIAAISIGCNPVIVRNVFTKLSGAGLLKPGMGKARTELGRPAEDITLYDVFAAVDGDDTDEIFRMYPVNARCPVGGEMHDLLVPLRQRRRSDDGPAVEDDHSRPCVRAAAGEEAPARGASRMKGSSQAFGGTAVLHHFFW